MSPTKNVGPACSFHYHSCKNPLKEEKVQVQALIDTGYDRLLQRKVIEITIVPIKAKGMKKVSVKNNQTLE